MPQLQTPLRNAETQEEIDREIDRWKEMYTSGMILRNHYKDEKELEADWRAYQNQYYELKCLSNNMAYRFYGMKNEEIYYKMKRYFLSHDELEDHPTMIYSPDGSKSLQEDSTLDLRADAITKATGYYILKNKNDNMKELNDQMYKFRSMPKSNRIKADTFSIQIYGKKNEERYNDIMPILMRKEPVEGDNDDVIEYDGSLNETVLYTPQSTYQNSTFNLLESYRHSISTTDSISEAVVLYNEAMKVETESPVEQNMKKLICEALIHKVHANEDTEDYLGQAPALLVEEVLELGVFYGRADKFIPGDNASNMQWFQDYQDRSVGLRPGVKITGQAWRNKLYSLYGGVMNDPNDNELKQELLCIGWNPTLDPYTQMQEASDRTNKLFRDNLGYNFIDLTEMVNALGPEDGRDETPNHGFYVIFTSEEGYGSLSQSMAKVYITADPDIKTLRPLSKQFFNSGVSLEELYSDINRKTNFHISVYYLRFSDEMYVKLKEMFDFLSSKISDFRFRYSILTGIINRLETREIANEKLFCAKILDIIMYAALYGYQDPGAYLSMNMLSSMVHTGDHKDNIYKIYDGPASMYNPLKISQMINYKENLGEYDDTLHEALYKYTHIIPVTEVATLPIDFDKDGAILIKRNVKADFAEEYAKTHKLLKQYSKAKGYEAMKYHVAKLWYMSILLEKIIHSPQKYDKETLTKHYNTRAHVIADFEKYMGEILQNEPNFDFQAYYKQTPFDKSTLKISKGIVDKVAGVLKAISHPTSLIKK